MKIHVPTCNRPQMFLDLVSRLQEFEVTGFVNNTSEENLSFYRSLNLPRHATLIYTDIAGEPKSCHVRTFQLMLKDVPGSLMILEDDVIPSENFYNEMMVRIGLLITQYRNFTLSPLYLPDRNSDFYTGIKSLPMNIGDFRFIRQGWVDGNFYMTADVVSAMRSWLQDPVKIYGASSGIGRKNSKMMAKQGWPMFTSIPTLVEHLDHESVMFGQGRVQTPLIARFGVC